MNKLCSKCKEIKDISNFSKLKDGLQSKCKKCTSIYDKLIYQKNKLKKIKQTSEYRKNNKEKIKVYLNKTKEIRSIKKSKYRQINAKYKTYNNKLTIDENPRLSKDNISLEVKCRYCGKYFIPNNSQTGHRIGSLKGNESGDQYLYCSDGCKLACPIYNKSKYPKDHKQITSREVQPQLRQLVLKRDNYTCIKCNKNIKEIELHCHHIYPLNESPITSTDIDECITLCKDCHKKYIWV